MNDEQRYIDWVQQTASEWHAPPPHSNWPAVRVSPATSPRFRPLRLAPLPALAAAGAVVLGTFGFASIGLHKGLSVPGISTTTPGAHQSSSGPQPPGPNHKGTGPGPSQGTLIVGPSGSTSPSGSPGPTASGSPGPSGAATPTPSGGSGGPTPTPTAAPTATPTPGPTPTGSCTAAPSATPTVIVCPSSPVVGDSLVFAGCGYAAYSSISWTVVSPYATSFSGTTADGSGCFNSSGWGYTALQAGTYTVDINKAAHGNGYAASKTFTVA